LSCGKAFGALFLKVIRLQMTMAPLLFSGEKRRKQNRGGVAPPTNQSRNRYTGGAPPTNNALLMVTQMNTALLPKLSKHKKSKPYVNLSQRACLFLYTAN